MKAFLLAFHFSLLTSHLLLAQDQAPNRREFTIVASDHRFTPDRIEVSQDDLVRVILRSDDRAYSFAIDAYRIVKRAGMGQTITFEFRADQPGRFDFYCNLTSDPACAEMRGVLVVAGKQSDSRRGAFPRGGAPLSGAERDPGCP